MNPGHAGMEFYNVAPKGELPPLTKPADTKWQAEGDVEGMPGWVYRGRRMTRGMGLMNFPRYIKRETRDFFYLTLRPVLPGKSLPAQKRTARDFQQGFPPSVAATQGSEAQAQNCACSWSKSIRTVAFQRKKEPPVVAISTCAVQLARRALDGERCAALNKGSSWMARRYSRNGGDGGARRDAGLRGSHGGGPLAEKRAFASLLQKMGCSRR
jgi:hypothetical protein